MRKLVVQMQITLDGFVGAPDGDVEWAYRSFDDQFTEWIVDSLWQSGVHIMGGVLAREMEAHWPTSTEPYAPPMNEIPKLVFSKSIDKLDWNQTSITRGDLAEEIAKLKQEPGKPILAHGGASFVQSLVKLGVVDEYRLVVHPVVLGNGLRIFPEQPEPLFLELVEIKRFGSGAAAHIYRPAKT